MVDVQDDEDEDVLPDKPLQPWLEEWTSDASSCVIDVPSGDLLGSFGDDRADDHERARLAAAAPAMARALCLAETGGVARSAPLGESDPGCAVCHNVEINEVVRHAADCWLDAALTAAGLDAAAREAVRNSRR